MGDSAFLIGGGSTNSAGWGFACLAEIERVPAGEGQQKMAKICGTVRFGGADVLDQRPMPHSLAAISAILDGPFSESANDGILSIG